MRITAALLLTGCVEPLADSLSVDFGVDGDLDQDPPESPSERGVTDTEPPIDGRPTPDSDVAHDAEPDISMHTERCNGLDDDGDGAADEDIAASPCLTDQPGICAPGRSDCFGGALVCLPVQSAGAEICDGLDNDCDGATDEAADGIPLTMPCYDGPVGTEGVGRCQGGSSACVDGAPGACEGQMLPRDEVCDGVDDDCDGDTDEGALNPCGQCGRDGLHPSGDCCLDALNRCGGCGREPAERCDGLDDDCDGMIDEDLERCGPSLRCNAYRTDRDRQPVAPPERDQAAGEVRLQFVEEYIPGGDAPYVFGLAFNPDGLFYVLRLHTDGLSAAQVCTLGLGGLGAVTSRPNQTNRMNVATTLDLARPDHAAATGELTFPLLSGYYPATSMSFTLWTATGRPGELSILPRGNSGDISAYGWYLRFGPSVVATTCAVDISAAVGVGQCVLSPPDGPFIAGFDRPITAITRFDMPDVVNGMGWNSAC
ncbi:MAG: hypothetical protein KC620_25060, partial [Myxococcales bacterium]|nr:hypothetical protein [Myxococcales bacterium]